MTSLVVDTHALLWYLQGSTRLSASAKAALDDAVTTNHRLVVPTISLVEILYLEERARLPDGSLARIIQAMSDDDGALLEAPFTATMVDAMRQIKREVVPELPDRMIAATALYLNLPLVTADHRIRGAGISTLW